MLTLYGPDGDSNHQPSHCLLNRLFRRTSKKTSTLRVTGLCVLRIHRWPVNSPHIWPVTQKMFPFDDVIMRLTHLYDWSSSREATWRLRVKSTGMLHNKAKYKPNRVHISWVILYNYNSVSGPLARWWSLLVTEFKPINSIKAFIQSENSGPS